MKRLFWFLAFASAPLVALTVLAQGSAAPPCTAAGDLRFVCGLQAPEDLVLIPNTGWLVANGMPAGSGVTLVDTQAKTVRPLFRANIASVQQDRTRYAACPAPLDAKVAVLHGLSVRAAQPAQAGRYTL